MEKVLVTGGLGFIGSNFIRHALENWKDAEITNVDCVSYGAVPANLSDLEGNPRYRFVKGDVSDIELLGGLVSGVDLLVHFAAETHVDRSISNPERFLHSNTVGTFALLNAAKKSSKLRRFVHISTDEVYGSAPSKTTFRETDRLEASSPYAASKAGAEMFVQAYHKTYGVKTVTLRCTNNFGARQFPEKFIPKTIISALLGRKIPIYGAGTQIRDWIYVLDFCRAIDLAIEKGELGGVYNVSASNEVPNLEVAEQILSILGKPGTFDFVEDRPGHDVRYSLDSSRIRNELGWKPAYSFDEALTQTVQWYVKNESWWRPLITEKVLSPTPWKENW